LDSRSAGQRQCPAPTAELPPPWSCRLGAPQCLPTPAGHHDVVVPAGGSACPPLVPCRRLRRGELATTVAIPRRSGCCWPMTALVSPLPLPGPGQRPAAHSRMSGSPIGDGEALLGPAD